MANYTLRDLYVSELLDLYAVEQRILQSLPVVIGVARSPELREALATHHDRTQIHAERLELLMNRADIAPRDDDESPIDKLIQTAEVQIGDGGKPHVRDAALAGVIGHIEHYEMAGYGAVRTYARMLEDDQAAELLQQTLDEEIEADKAVTQIAEAEVEHAPPAQGKPRSRLRYVAVDDLGADIKYRGYKIHNPSGEDLGRLDGFLVDRSGNPVYLVNESGGWFNRRRYAVPAGNVKRRTDNKILMIDIDKETFKRYPAFHRDAFAALSDEEARRYEWRVLEALDPKAARRAVAAWNYEQFACFVQPDWLRVAAPTSTRQLRIEVPAPQAKAR